MPLADSPGWFARWKETLLAKRVFGFFLVIALAGFGWSVTHPPLGLDAFTGTAKANEAGLAYAACQADIRRAAVVPVRLAFPGEPESVETAGDSLSLSSSITATPQLGAPYTQHFTCRAARTGRGAHAVWKVTRMAMDLPVT